MNTWIQTIGRLVRALDPVRFMVPTPGLAQPDSLTTGEPTEPLSEPRDIEAPATTATLVEPEIAVAEPFARIELANGTAISFAATAPKDPGMPDTNEDAWAYHRQFSSVAVFDGATESFAARRWVRILAEQFTQTGQLDLPRAQEEYVQGSDTPQSWAQEAAAERGSFTTVAAYLPEADQIMLVGDSAILDVVAGEIVASWPYLSAAEFASTPEALGSSADLLDQSQAALDSGVRTLPSPDVPDDPRQVILATDAVAAWLLTDSHEDRRSRLNEVWSCSTDQDWLALVATERAAGRMKVDDSTIVVLDLP